MVWKILKQNHAKVYPSSVNNDCSRINLIEVSVSEQIPANKKRLKVLEKTSIWIRASDKGRLQNLNDFYVLLLKFWAKIDTKCRH